MSFGNKMWEFKMECASAITTHFSCSFSASVYCHSSNSP